MRACRLDRVDYLIKEGRIRVTFGDRGKNAVHPDRFTLTFCSFLTDSLSIEVGQMTAITSNSAARTRRGLLLLRCGRPDA